ncbi:MAG: hypothetical protein DBX55_07635 [Verrucomicrobia bacterium]|nr:MAG: hypothetical protein DBX55_07635 [Verrucomicrobiota bacterium]
MVAAHDMPYPRCRICISALQYNRQLQIFANADPAGGGRNIFGNLLANNKKAVCKISLSPQPGAGRALVKNLAATSFKRG